MFRGAAAGGLFVPDGTQSQLKWMANRQQLATPCLYMENKRRIDGAVLEYSRDCPKALCGRNRIFSGAKWRQAGRCNWVPVLSNNRHEKRDSAISPLRLKDMPGVPYLLLLNPGRPGGSGSPRRAEVAYNNRRAASRLPSNDETGKTASWFYSSESGAGWRGGGGGVHGFNTPAG